MRLHPILLIVGMSLTCLGMRYGLCNKTAPAMLCYGGALVVLLINWRISE